ncbi:putative Ribokinase-like superfamily protein [Babesia divergens]|uniref:Ribokinase-like superfamily protein n=1 Tax=Babesia divergens TaxID=32595 RepID=A0AAD9GAH4_BABDI|nr:putative Ribokinase-like superfamily protein [Babesia divergens]
MLGGDILENGPGRILMVGHPMMDIYACVEQDVIDITGVRRGESNRISLDVFNVLQEKVRVNSKNPGGSCASTARSYAYLGGNVSYFGICGEDELATKFEDCLTECGVKVLSIRKKDHPTSQTYCLVTPDAERTMCVLFGASHTLKLGDMDGSIMDNFDFYVVSGYMFADEDQTAFTHYMVDEALKRGKRIITTFSNSFCVRRNGHFLKPIAEKSAYITGNLEEFTELYEMNDREALFSMFEKRTVGENPMNIAVVITMGAEGAVIIYQGKRLHIPAPPVEKVVDTTGAGDFFAGGVLYGLLNGLSVRKAGALGAVMAGDIIGHVGTLITDDLPARVKAVMESA